eukprot:GFUD01000486.1.p1 GENE.GFUD01000486.1~~GFUD01000486.1.p1  ORF type:complete len:291 (-),score=107.05 GFUD01000486.1:62-934(-)
MSVPGVQMTPYPSDPDTAACLSGHVPQFSQPVSRHQVLEVTSSPVVSSSNSEQNNSHVRDNSLCSGRQSDNIGSIITMLISDQSVDLEDYLTDPVLRQEGEMLDKEHLLQADIKEETLSETVQPHPVPAYCQGQEFDYYNSEFLQNETLKSRSSSRSEGDEENSLYRYQQPSPAFSTISYCKPGYSPLVDMSNYAGRRQPGLATDTLVTGRHPDNEKKDDKYWERRRKNNLAAKKSRDSRRVRENQLRLRVLCLENANRVLREQMDRKEGELVHIRERLNKYENCQTNYL